jgi:hypothetical protein
MVAPICEYVKAWKRQSTIASVSKEKRSAPGQRKTTQAKLMSPEDERLIQWTPKIMASNPPIALTSPEAFLTKSAFSANSRPQGKESG